ncbi:MAG: hypothetical protein LBK60_05875 [Verrucomicrobiales bacterium]|jgi:hypothetical protein|nr:hypothetical protein [Verrucomicrobiales bacterium]
MAIFIPGMCCSISGRVIKSADEVVMFSPFVSNQADPLHAFSDAVIHIEVFRKHPLMAQVQTRYEECRQQNLPKSRLCLVCGKQITDPDDYLGLGHLVDDKRHKLNRFNYAHFHYSCLAGWPELPELINNLERFEQSGEWKGPALKWCIKELRREAGRT